MASGTGTYFAAKLLNQIFGGTAYTWTNISQIDLALYTTGGITAGGVGTELTSGTAPGYVRFGMAQSTTTFPTTATNTISNNVTLTPFSATGTWVVATTLAMYEHGNSNLLFFGDLAASKTLSNGDQFQFTVGNLSITQS